MAKNVVITIQPDGTTVIEANEFAGVGCKAATRELEMVLAGNVGNTETKPKDDYWATNPGSNTITGR